MQFNRTGVVDSSNVLSVIVECVQKVEKSQARMKVLRHQ